MRKLALLLVTLAAAPACAVWKRPPDTGASGEARKYPPRPASCKLAVFKTPTPGVAAWDDIGLAEVACHINTGHPECMGRLRAEACRMGGDILYAVPDRPLRPRDEVLLFRGQVAHTVPDKQKAPDKPEAPPEPASSGPIEPLVAPPAPPAAPDAGARG